MRRGRILILVLLILVVGVAVAAFAIYQFVLRAQPAQPAFVAVYRTSQNIPQGAKITDGMITTVTLPQENALEVYFTESERTDLLNNKVARYPLEQGHILSSADIQDASQAVAIGGPQWAALIPPGMTTITIPTKRIYVAGYGISDGAHVNVNACFLFVDVDPSFQTILPNSTSILTGTGFVPESLPVLSMGVSPSGGPQGRVELEPSLQQPFFILPSEAQRPRLVCQMMLQDVVVMKLGNFPLTGTAAAPAQGAAPVLPDLVTLIVSPQDSVTFSYILFTNTQVIMTLRNPNDLARQATEAANLQFLLSQYNIPVPAKLPYAMQPATTTLSAPSLPNDNVAPAQ
ncbi:MAG: hypothetical protein A2Y54_10775 [Chloroflexi bacterium RBG_16_51_16]|nr:MAG: hypothetical protein A2Y54_10775 [Chloroflexi bacterium RBG_16_51_16]